MKLELKTDATGTHFVIAVCSEVLGKQIVIPLSEALSRAIHELGAAENLKPGKLIVPRGADRRQRH